MTVASSARPEPEPRTASREAFRRVWACERGAELVEFAFVFPTLLLVMLGIIDFGFLFQRYEVVTNAAREGARVAILPGYADADVQARVNQYLSAAGLTPTDPGPSAPRRRSRSAANASRSGQLRSHTSISFCFWVRLSV